MNKLVPILFSLLLIVACDNTEPELFEFKAYNSSSVIEEYPHVESGNSLVLHYFYEAEEEEQIADDEFAEDFFIEINHDEDLLDLSIEDSFDLNIDQLKELSHIYKQYCFCIFADQTRIVSGTLSGNKNSNGHWKVTGSISVELGYLNPETEVTEWYHERVMILDGIYGISNRPSN